MVKSSTVLKYVGQYAFLVGAVGWIGHSLFDAYTGFSRSDLNTDEIATSGVVGLLHLVAFFYLKNKFVVAEFIGQSIRIIKDKEIVETTWAEIESLNRVIFSSPPIYIMTLKNKDGFYIFWNSAISLFWSDDSRLGELISQKKRKLNI